MAEIDGSEKRQTELTGADFLKSMARAEVFIW